jgi:hypothetical protein
MAQGIYMAQYQRIEYLIGKDGKITERVLGGSGAECVAATSGIEASLGQVQQRDLLPEYYETSDYETTETTWQNTENQTISST